jgi:hypothetical protein
MAISYSERNVKDGLGGPFGAVVVVRDGEIIACSGKRYFEGYSPASPSFSKKLSVWSSISRRSRLVGLPVPRSRFMEGA